MLNEPRSTERDNQNSLRKYPFSDAASCTGKTGIIPPGAIIDAQLYVPGREPGRVWLSSIGTDGRLRFSDGAGEFAELSSAATPNSAVPVTFTGDGGPCHGGVVVFGNEADVSALLSLGGQRFTYAQTELAPAAVSWPGLPGVLGFKLDDGNVVYGAVKIKGANGCRVATYVSGGKRMLRVSAMGKTAASAAASGFITKVVVTSDNTTFVVSRRDVSGKVVDVLATGVSTFQDDKLNADQENMCSQVRTKLNTVPSERAAGTRTCEDAACDPVDTATRKIMLFGANGNSSSRVTWTTNANDSYIPAMTGVELGPLLSSQIAAAPAGKRFIGYYDAAAKTAGTTLTMYYRYDGTPARKFTLDHDLNLYAHFLNLSSQAEVTFENYGTLHLAAPNVEGYTNPIRISGQENPVPAVHEYKDQVIEAGGAEAVANIILHPEVPSGEVRIGLRGANKVSIL